MQTEIMEEEAPDLPIRPRRRGRVLAWAVATVLVVSTALIVSFWFPVYANENRHIEKDAKDIALNIDQMPQGWVVRGTAPYFTVGMSNMTDSIQALFTYSSKISGNAALLSSVMVFDSVDSANWMYSEQFNDRLGPDQVLKGSQGVGYQSKMLYDPSGPSDHPYTRTIVFTYGNVYAEIAVTHDDLFEMSDSELASLGKKMVKNMT